MKTSFATLRPCLLAVTLTASFTFAADNSSTDGKQGASVKEQHSDIGLSSLANSASQHTRHPDAQWFPDAGLGLFLHWGINTVKELNISWSMIPGRALGKKRIGDPAERARIEREQDYNLTGRKPEITPNEYWALAREFNPQKYDPDKWCKAAADAGFTYVVLTTRHHDGFSLWPSDCDDFNTKNFMGGRDLVKPFVEACRKYGLKVGLYYSPPNWHYERNYKSFLYHAARAKNPEFPELDADLQPLKNKIDPKDLPKFQAGYDKLVRGQVRELLTRYGKIDVLWFDGKQSTPHAAKSITAEEIRQLQPGILINPRLHGKGDFITYERDLTTNKVSRTWAEFCNTWGTMWVYQRDPFRSNAFILGQLARCRSLGINYLLGIGPDKDGQLHPNAYQNMAVIGGWMSKHREAVQGAKPLPEGESASVPATALGTKRHLFAIPEFKMDGDKQGMYDKDMLPIGDVSLVLNGVKARPASVTLMGDGSPLLFDYQNQSVTVNLPANRRSKLVDVVQIQLTDGTTAPQL